MSKLNIIRANIITKSSATTINILYTYVTNA